MTKSKLEKFEKSAIDLKEYAIGQKYPNCDIYRIPFRLIEETRTLGIINWNFEIIRSKKRKRMFIEKMYIWVRQTRDERVAGKVFKLNLFSEKLCGNIFNKHSFVEPCSVHSKGTIISTYPKNKYSNNNEYFLEINASTSVMVEINLIKIMFKNA